MKALKFLLLFLVIIGLAVLVGFGMLGYVPGLSKVLGATTPKDLGVAYTEADYTSARAKSQLEYVKLPDTTPLKDALKYEGSLPYTGAWTSAEITALMNKRPSKYWPLKNVQFKMNDDGTAEASGLLDSAKLAQFATIFTVPDAVTSKIPSVFPAEVAVYLKLKASLIENKIGEFDILEAQMGKMPIPTGLLLGNLPKGMLETAYAETLTGELSGISGKRQIIIDFINQRMPIFVGFYAKSANFQGGKLNFDGTLSKKEYSVQ